MGVIVMWGLSPEDWIAFGGLLVLAALLVNLGSELKKLEREDANAGLSPEASRADRSPPPSLPPMH